MDDTTVLVPLLEECLAVTSGGEKRQDGHPGLLGLHIFRAWQQRWHGQRRNYLLINILEMKGQLALTAFRDWIMGDFGPDDNATVVAYIKHRGALYLELCDLVQEILT